MVRRETPARSTIADTFSRLLRLNVASGPPLVTLKQLMDESEAQIEFAAQRGKGSYKQIAQQLLASPIEYRNWESSHS